MTSIGPYSQSTNYTHMFDIPDLRGQLPVENSNKISVETSSGKYVCKDTITGIINTHPDFKRMKYILELSGLEGLYGDYQTNSTIFVPSDMMIKDKIPEGVFTNMDRATARTIVRGSTLNRKIPSSILSDSPSSFFNTIDPANRILVTNMGDRIKLNDSINVIHKNMMSGNGIIHVVDDLIIPTFT